ncbi:pre-mRNA-splicing regulator WTAP-like isoform X1 [Oratosquilla oratoria]
MSGEPNEEEQVVATPVAERISLTADQLAAVTKEELSEKWSQQEKFVEAIQAKVEALQQEVEELRRVKENEEKLRGQLAEAQRKEQYLIMRLSCKEHELQDLAAQIQELKSPLGGVAGLKHCLLDPAVNLLFERLKRDLDSARAKMEETQNELSAWKFTPDSNTGKQLMAKCRLLIKENEELGRMISSGRLAKLEGDLALQKNYSEELKKSQSELDEFILEMDEDTEGMQGTIYYLQQQLREAKERISQLTAQLSNSQAAGDANTIAATTTTPATPPPSHLQAEAHEQQEQQGAPLSDDVGRTHQANGGTPHSVVARTSDSPLESDQLSVPLTNGRKRTRSEAEGDIEGEHEENEEEVEEEEEMMEANEEKVVVEKGKVVFKGEEGEGVDQGLDIDGQDGQIDEGGFECEEGVPPKKRNRLDPSAGEDRGEQQQPIENGVSDAE